MTWIVTCCGFPDSVTIYRHFRAKGRIFKILWNCRQSCALCRSKEMDSVNRNLEASSIILHWVRRMWITDRCWIPFRSIDVTNNNVLLLLLRLVFTSSLIGDERVNPMLCFRWLANRFSIIVKQLHWIRRLINCCSSRRYVSKLDFIT